MFCVSDSLPRCRSPSWVLRLRHRKAQFSRVKYNPIFVGFGLTPGRGPQDYSNVAQGNFLIQFLETLEEKAHLAGKSNGRWMVEYIAHERPDLVKKLVIINSLNGSPPIANPKVKPITYVFPEGPITKELVEMREKRLYLDQALVTGERINLVYETAKEL